MRQIEREKELYRVTFSLTERLKRRQEIRQLEAQLEAFDARG